MTGGGPGPRPPDRRPAGGGPEGGGAHPARELIARDEAETMEAARRLAALLADGDLVLLTGALGAGKTIFVKGLASGLGIDPRLIHSPTFTLAADHRGARRLGHADLYRVVDPRETEELGIDDLREVGAIVAVEWGERLPERMRRDAWEVRLEVLPDGARRVTIERRRP